MIACVTARLTIAALIVGFTVLDAPLRGQIGPFLESERSVYPLRSGNNFRFRISIGDITGDGIPDIAAGSSGAAPLAHQPTGRWSSMVVDMSARPLGVSGALFSNRVSIGDVDGDGHLDMFVAQLDAGLSLPPTVLLGNGTAQMRAVYGRGVDSVRGDNSFGSILFDADGDGDLDALMWSMVGYQDRLFLNDGRGYFADVTTTHLPPLTLNTLWVAHADLDRDGDQDLVVAQSEGPTLVLHNDGSGRFQVAQTLHEIQLAEHVSLGDLDGDGFPDAYVGTWMPERDFLLKNDGTGRFVDAILGMPNATGVTRTFCTAFGDLDGDGLPEIVIGAGIQYSPVVWRNLGNLRFEDVTSQVFLAQAPPNRGPISSVAIADMDGDGDLDLVVLADAPLHEQGGRVLYNVTRQIEAPVTATRGSTLDVKLYARSGRYVFPFVTGRTLPTPIAIPNLGLIGIDPAGMVALPVRQVASGQTFATLSIPVPNDIGLVGGLLWFQGVDTNGADAHLTNWLRVEIR